MKKLNIQQVKTYIESQGPNTKIYIGADSIRVKRHNRWYADYTLVIVVHIDGCHGCKIFGETHTELDYDQKQSKPSMRLMNEVYKVSELFQNLKEALEDRKVEVHLDINPDHSHGSSCVIQQAIGYIKGTCNVIPMVKPNAFAASYAADRYNSLKTA